MSKEILRSGEVARILGVSRKTVYKWTIEGRLKAFRLPTGEFRYRKSDIEEFLKEMEEWKSRKR